MIAEGLPDGGIDVCRAGDGRHNRWRNRYKHAGVCSGINPGHVVVIAFVALFPADADVLAATALVVTRRPPVITVGEGDVSGAVLVAVIALVVDDHLAGIEGVVLVRVDPDHGTIVTASAE